MMNQLNVRLTDRHTRMINELATIYGSRSTALRMAIEKLYNEVNIMKHFINESERYGDRVVVTIDDYRELNPDGDFFRTDTGIYESLSDKPGDIEKIASRI